MGLFSKQNTQQLTERQKLEARYNSGRSNLLWVLIFTAINIGLLLMNQYTYFLFSAFIPYVIVVFGMQECGKLPPEHYEFDMSQYEFADSSFLTGTVIVAVVLCALYLLCWLLSKKGKVAWLIVGLVLFCLDTALMLLNGISVDSILDVVFHIYVIVSMIGGVIAHSKLKKLPPEAPTGPDIVE